MSHASCTVLTILRSLQSSFRLASLAMPSRVEGASSIMYDVHADAGQTALSDSDRHGVHFRSAAAEDAIAYAVHVLCDITF